MGCRSFKITDRDNQPVTDVKAMELGHIVAGSEEYWKDRLNRKLPKSPNAKMLSNAIKANEVALGPTGAEILAILEHFEACGYKLEID